MVKKKKEKLLINHFEKIYLQLETNIYMYFLVSILNLLICVVSATKSRKCSCLPNYVGHPLYIAISC